MSTLNADKSLLELLSSDTPPSEPASTDRSTFDHDRDTNDEGQDDIEHFFHAPLEKSTDIRKNQSAKIPNQSQKQNGPVNNFNKSESEKPKTKTRNALLGSQHLTSKTKPTRKNPKRNFSRKNSSSDDSSSTNNLNITNDTDEKCGTYRVNTDSNVINQNELNPDIDSNVDGVDISEHIERYEPPPQLFKSNKNHQQYNDDNKLKDIDEEHDEIKKRRRAASVIQIWWRRVRIRQTAGAAAIKRMMEQKQVMMKERLCMERETVSSNIMRN